MKKIIMGVCCALSLAAIASEPSPAQQLRKHFVNGCVARGIQRNDEAVEVTNFCTCTFDVLSKELTIQEYIELDKASLEKRSLDSVPAISRVKPKLSLCKK